MSVKVKYGDDPSGFAQRLLAAADEIEADRTQVVFSPDGHFTVSEDVAEAAGVSYDHEDAPESAPEDEVDPESTEEPEDPENGSEEFDASEFKGKALDEALEERGLSIEGKADEKRARLAEFENSQNDTEE